MNILFLTISRLKDISSRGIYTDLMRELVKRGNKVYIVSPSERRFGEKTHLIEGDGYKILRVKTLNLQKTNAVEKGVGQLLMEFQYDSAISKYFGDIDFDLILYSTPPITFNRVIERQKKRTGARTYLMLKDIFPQNAVDLGMMSDSGPLYRLFRNKEKTLYSLSDKIGCMSPANCDYVLKENPEVPKSKVELCPNAVDLSPVSNIAISERQDLLGKLGIPDNKTLFIYGGNLGKPQGVDFLLEVVKENEKEPDSFIIVVGSGTEYPRIAHWFEQHSPKNSKLLSALPKEDYDKLVRVCQVGLIFLDPRFTIPNFPSRLLSYLENRMPVLLATDRNTDMGRIAENGNFGFWCENGDMTSFMANMRKLANNKTIIKNMGEAGYNHLLSNYTVDKVADIIEDK